MKFEAAFHQVCDHNQSKMKFYHPIVTVQYSVQFIASICKYETKPTINPSLTLCTFSIQDISKDNDLMQREIKNNNLMQSEITPVVSCQYCKGGGTPIQER